MNDSLPPCPLCIYLHEPGACPPSLDPDENLFSADLIEATPHLCACGAKFLGAPGSSGCPLCTRESLFRRTLWLADLEQRLRIALADVTGQRASILKHLQSKAYVPPKGPCESYRCETCNGWLHLGYVNPEPHKYICEPCALRVGLTAFLTVVRSEYCHHMYPVAMCELCRYQFARKRREALQTMAPKIQREIAKAEATGSSNATVEDI